MWCQKSEEHKQEKNTAEGVNIFSWKRKPWQTGYGNRKWNLLEKCLENSGCYGLLPEPRRPNAKSWSYFHAPSLYMLPGSPPYQPASYPTGPLMCTPTTCAAARHHKTLFCLWSNSSSPFHNTPSLLIFSCVALAVLFLLICSNVYFGLFTLTWVATWMWTLLLATSPVTSHYYHIC